MYRIYKNFKIDRKFYLIFIDFMEVCNFLSGFYAFGSLMYFSDNCSSVQRKKKLQQDYIYKYKYQFSFIKNTSITYLTGIYLLIRSRSPAYMLGSFYINVIFRSFDEYLSIRIITCLWDIQSLLITIVEPLISIYFFSHDT